MDQAEAGRHLIDDVELTDVDGLPTLFCPRAGPRFSAGLLFRVGRADETLATSGITHLVEHLALHRHAGTSPHSNGETADNFTHFYVEGNEAQVRQYFIDLAAGFNELPLHRLTAEKEILAVEASGRTAGPLPAVHVWRYGAQGYGLLSYDELGLRRIGAQEVEEWARDNFTRGNAVLWIAGPSVPATLSLELPDGRRSGLPETSSMLPDLPVWFEFPQDVIGLDAVVPRSTRAMLTAQILSRALFKSLRHAGAHTYSASASYRPRDDKYAKITALADCPGAKRDVLTAEFINVLSRLRTGDVPASELEVAQEAARHVLDEPDPLQVLPGLALNLLWGHANPPRARLVEEINEFTLADLRDSADELYAASLLQLPMESPAPEGFASAPDTSSTEIEGSTFRPIGFGAPTIVVGSLGVTARHKDRCVTVRFNECVALECYPDGGRRLTAPDGFSIAVEPTLNRLKSSALSTIDASVSPDVVLPMPERPQYAIPMPFRPPGIGRPFPRWVAIPMFGALCIGAAFFAFAGVVIVVNVILGRLDMLAGGLLSIVITGFLGIGAFKTYFGNIRL